MNSILKKMKKIWQNIWNGLDILITILIAVVVVVLRVMGVIKVTDQSLISSLILGILALVSFSMLRDRYRDEQIRNALLRIENTSVPSENFFEDEFDRQALSGYICKSRQSFLWGMTLWRTVPLLTQSIENGLKNGLDMRVLLIKPCSNAAKMAAFRTRHGNVDKIKEELSANLRELQNLAKQQLRGKLEVRVIDYLAPWTIYVFDPHLDEGQMIVRLTPFRAPKRPNFKLSARKDKKWFQYFLSQFEAVWEQAESIETLSETKTN